MARFLEVAAYRTTIYLRHFPTDSWLEVKGLALPEFLVEIAPDAHRSRQGMGPEGRSQVVPEGGTVQTDSSVRYVIDAEDRIAFVDEGWGRFAEANDGGGLLQPAILGQSLWDHIADPTTRTLYQQIVSRVRKGRLARFTLRCDGPACRRRLGMTITAAPDGSVTFETRAVSVEAREPVALLSRSAPRSTDLLRACAWCNRIDVGSDSADWVEVEEATERLRLFELARMPQLTHGICEACLATMMGTLASLEASPDAGR